MYVCVMGGGGGGGDYSRKAINRATAIIRGNTVFLFICTYLARTKILSIPASRGFPFSSHFCLGVKDLCEQGRYWVLFENRKK